MTRPPPGVSFAQFFPNAPKVKAEAQGRDKNRGTNDDSDLSGVNTAAQDSATDALTSPSVNGTSQAPPHHDEDSLLGDMPSTVDSGSSHASSSSSLFSNAAARMPPTSSSRLTSHIPAVSSPLHSSNTSTLYPQASTTASADSASHTMKLVNGSASSLRLAVSEHPGIQREVARQSGVAVKGRKCTYDPILERMRNKSVSKTAKPVYKEFGMVC